MSHFASRDFAVTFGEYYDMLEERSSMIIKIHLIVNEDNLYKADYEMVFSISFIYEYMGR